MASRGNGVPDECGDSYVTGRTKQGVEIRCPLRKLSPYRVVFEIYLPPADLRVSQALDGFKIIVSGLTVYEGRAVIISLIHLGVGVMCEASLDDTWVDPDFHVTSIREKGGSAAFNQFVKQWQKNYKIRPEFKVIVADMQTFFTDMKLWLDQVELGIRAGNSNAASGDDIEIASQLVQSTTPAITTLFEKYEASLAGLDEDYQSVYQNFGKRQLHPLLLCSPFLHRTYTKPLGYAGDYEMVNMICRNPFEGETLYAKVVNYWFLQQAPAEAHRNRITFLVERIKDAVLQAAREGRMARITTIGCGPAQEVQRFIAESDLSDRAHFKLVDFNEETANYTHSLLEGIKRKHGRRTQIETVRKSVHQILKEAGRGDPSKLEKFDFVYCAGLFDYLSDQTCHKLTNILYDSVMSGGTFVSTNVDTSNPRRLTMDYLMDWHLIYRNAGNLAALKPDAITPDEGRVSADATGANIFYTVNKPRD